MRARLRYKIHAGRQRLEALRPGFANRHRDSWKDAGVAAQMLTVAQRQLSQPGGVAPFTAFLEAIDGLTGRLLEHGAGVGQYGALLTEQRPDIDYTGADYSAELVAAGRQAFPGLRLVVDDALDSRLDWGAYDVVCANGLIEVLPEPERALRLFLACPAPVVVLHRQRLTHRRTHVVTEGAYEGQRTYRAFVNAGHLEALVVEHGRRITRRYDFDGWHHTFVMPTVSPTSP